MNKLLTQSLEDDGYEMDLTRTTCKALSPKIFHICVWHIVTELKFTTESEIVACPERDFNGLVCNRSSHLKSATSEKVEFGGGPAALKRRKQGQRTPALFKTFCW